MGHRPQAIGHGAERSVADVLRASGVAAGALLLQGILRVRWASCRRLGARLPALLPREGALRAPVEALLRAGSSALPLPPAPGSGAGAPDGRPAPELPAWRPAALRALRLARAPQRGPRPPATARVGRGHGARC